MLQPVLLTAAEKIIVRGVMTGEELKALLPHKQEEPVLPSVTNQGIVSACLDALGFRESLECRFFALPVLAHGCQTDR